MQGIPDALQYTWEILQHLMIPKPQHPYTTHVKVARATRIAGAPWRSVVLRAIDLNRQSHCGAIEIQHKVCDGVLFTKAETIELFATGGIATGIARRRSGT